VHRVRDHETLETVAGQYGVSYSHLVLHNFGTTDPAVINWYLHHYVGCVLPTHDHKNWRFSSTVRQDAARPGLIYIPPKPGLHMDPIDVVGGTRSAPVADLRLPGWLEDLKLPGFEIPVPLQFVYEWPKGPFESGPFLWRVKFKIKGELKPQHEQHGRVWKFSFKDKKQLKVAVENKLSEDTKNTFGVKWEGAPKFQKKTLEPLVKAWGKRSKGEAIDALSNIIEATITTKETYSWRGVPFKVVPEAGLEFSTTPAVFRVSVESKDLTLAIGGALFKCKFGGEATINVGLSKKGWAWVTEEVAGPAIEWLVAEGVVDAVVVGAVAGTYAAGAALAALAIPTLCIWAIQNEKNKGDLKMLASWYVQAYADKVFSGSNPYGYQRPQPRILQADLQNQAVQLVLLGEQDALKDAQANLAKSNPTSPRGTDAQALKAFHSLLLAENNGREGDAKRRLMQTLEEKARKLAER
jgi:hypothetical protein